MSWEKYKSIFEKNYPNESQFIVGIDLGNATSTIAYFDLNKKEPEVIDISGGYGKPNTPTIVQFVKDSDDWIFGEYALLNSATESDIKVSSIIDKLGRNEYIFMDDKRVKITTILGRFIKELISNCKNLNPKANIAGIIVSVPSYFDNQALTELNLAFVEAGYEHYIINFVQDRKCVLSRYFYQRDVKDEKIFLIDFGSRSLKAGAYTAKIGNDKINMECIMSLSAPDLGESAIGDMVMELFLKPLVAKTNKSWDKFSRLEKDQLITFVHANKDLLFQKNITNKPIKLYYNFVHPPFQQSFNYDDVKDLIKDFKSAFRDFIISVLEKSATFNNNRKLTVDDIDAVVCTGGGFEMLWAKNLVKEIFDSEKIFLYKNSKSVIAEGAAIIAANELGVIDAKKIIMVDKNLLNMDIGVKYFDRAAPKFFVVAKTNMFWWDKFKPCFFLINKETSTNLDINLMKRESDGKTTTLKTITLDGLPIRPKGTTKLKLDFNFIRNDLLNLTIEDAGFGELFPKTDYKRDFLVNID